MKMEDYEKFSDKFVLSYIIKTTVSHEKYTNYRKKFAEENLLDYVKDNPDLNDRIREINLWCREKLRFVSTSGRTQDPLSVLQKSNIGRCGEMQVFFISVCRTKVFRRVLPGLRGGRIQIIITLGQRFL